MPERVGAVHVCLVNYVRATTVPMLTCDALVTVACEVHEMSASDSRPTSANVKTSVYIQPGACQPP